MTNEQLDEIAAKVYHDIYGTDAFHKEEVIEFARRLLAEVQKMQEPVAWFDEDADYVTTSNMRNTSKWKPLYKALGITE